MLQYLSLVLAGLLAAGALAEAALRLLPPTSPGPTAADSTQTFMVPDQRTGWLPRKSTELELRDPTGSPFLLRLNSTGQRGPELPDLSSGERRVLFLGDSFTMGTQVREEETFVAVVDSLLPGVLQAINGGVNGFNTYQELAYYRYVGRQLEPDLVVLCFFPGNDFRDNMVRTSLGRALNPLLIPRYHRFLDRQDPLLRDMRQSPLRDPLSGAVVPAPAWEWLAQVERHSLFARLLGSRYARLMGRWTKDLGLIDLDNQYYFYEIGFYQRRGEELFQTAGELTLACIESLGQLVAGEGAQFAVALLPSQNQVDPMQWRRTLQQLGLDDGDLGVLDKTFPNRLLGEWCAKRGIPFLDLTPPFAAMTDPGELYLTSIGDLHFSPAGHRLAGTLLASWISHGVPELFSAAIDSFRNAQILTRVGDFPEAVQRLSAATRLRPAWSSPLLWLGALRASTGQWDSSRAAFERAVAVDPTSLKGWKGMAEALAHLGQYRQAAEALERAARLQPEWWPYQERLAKLYAQAGDESAALACLSRVEEVFESPSSIREYWWAEHTSNAIQAMGQRRWLQAEQELNRAIRFVPAQPQTYSHLGRLFEQTSRPDQALTVYRQLAKLDPGFPGLQEKLRFLQEHLTSP